ncbi:MAG: protein kinase [Aphanothece sp. CMT-3BRIN-NPC111]|jgi:serine/threonine-protein kinase|nr:protein kinase [Aphanothece sp. CMT-3BRIN-NPC111]
MVKLTLLHPQGSTPVQQWNFERESSIRIGRSPENDVVLNDPLVSRHHLELRRVGIPTPQASVQWQLVNQGTNGTFLNGILVSQALVPNDSLIQLARGGPMLKFQIQELGVKIPHSPLPTSPVCTHAGNPPGSLFCIHCGQPVVQAQQFVRQYQVLRTLGQGGMGTTYLAWDKEATKAGRPQMLVLKEMNTDMAQISKARELFEREARILEGLHHPGIPQYYDFFVEGGKKYLAMELIHGQDLEKRIYNQGPVILPQAIEWMIQTCDILDYIHRQDPPLIHRDIKPANLMVRHLDNRVIVLDFGAVKEIGTAPGTRIGAEGYSAPEQDRGQPCTQSDLYAIGPTLIFLLTGENPMSFYRRVGSVYRFDVQTIPTITPKLRGVIERVTEPKPRDRYQTAKELSQAMDACR